MFCMLVGPGATSTKELLNSYPKVANNYAERIVIWGQNQAGAVSRQKTPNGKRKKLKNEIRNNDKMMIKTYKNN